MKILLYLLLFLSHLSFAQKTQFGIKVGNTEYSTNSIVLQTPNYYVHYNFFDSRLAANFFVRKYFNKYLGLQVEAYHFYTVRDGLLAAKFLYNGFPWIGQFGIYHQTLKPSISGILKVRRNIDLMAGFSAEWSFDKSKNYLPLQPRECIDCANNFNHLVDGFKTTTYYYHLSLNFWIKKRFLVEFRIDKSLFSEVKELMIDSNPHRLLVKGNRYFLNVGYRLDNLFPKQEPTLVFEPHIKFGIKIGSSTFSFWSKQFQTNHLKIGYRPISYTPFNISTVGLFVLKNINTKLGIAGDVLYSAAYQYAYIVDKRSPFNFSRGYSLLRSYQSLKIAFSASIKVRKNINLLSGFTFEQSLSASTMCNLFYTYDTPDNRKICKQINSQIYRNKMAYFHFAVNHWYRKRIVFEARIEKSLTNFLKPIELEGKLIKPSSNVICWYLNIGYRLDGLFKKKDKN